MSSIRICPDANLVVRLLVVPEDLGVRELWSQWRDERRLISAPALLYYEVTNVLHRYRFTGQLDTANLRAALDAALQLPIEVHWEPGLHVRAAELADRFGLAAAYDAHYLALAEHLGAEFWTADRRLARAVSPDLDWVRQFDIRR